jgi:catechol 2,3-dioxygenase
MCARGSGGIIGAMTSSSPIDPGATIGHVHLKIAGLERALAFYRDALGFKLQGRIGDQAAFLSANDYHHHIGLNTFESEGGERPAPGTTGLYHVAVRYPDRAALVNAVRRVQDHGYAIDHGSDHGANEAVYLDDPDGNGIELYWDRPVEEWPRTPAGDLALVNLPLDVDALLSRA